MPLWHSRGTCVDQFAVAQGLTARLNRHRAGFTSALFPSTLADSHLLFPLFYTCLFPYRLVCPRCRTSLSLAPAMSFLPSSVMLAFTSSAIGSAPRHKARLRTCLLRCAYARARERARVQAPVHARVRAHVFACASVHLRACAPARSSLATSYA
eukprot:3659716-Pleurochrysis_carterae.AAC.1